VPGSRISPRAGGRRRGQQLNQRSQATGGADRFGGAHDDPIATDHQLVAFVGRAVDGRGETYRRGERPDVVVSGAELDRDGRLIRYRVGSPRDQAQARAPGDLRAESFGHRRDAAVYVGDRRARPERELALLADLEPRRSRDDRVAHRFAFLRGQHGSVVSGHRNDFIASYIITVLRTAAASRAPGT
jgi:hypothetical protein